LLLITVTKLINVIVAITVNRHLYFLPIRCILLCESIFCVCRRKRKEVKQYDAIFAQFAKITHSGKELSDWNFFEWRKNKLPV